RIETNNDGLILAVLDRLVQKLYCRVFFEFQLIQNGVASIHQHHNIQWQVPIEIKAFDGLWFIVLGQPEILLFQIRDELAFAVFYRKENIDAVDIDINRRLPIDTWLLLQQGCCRPASRCDGKQCNQHAVTKVFHDDPDYSIARSAGSSMISTPNSLALSNFEPGSRPAKTKSVFLLTDFVTRPPNFEISASASSRVMPSRVPVITKVLPARTCRGRSCRTSDSIFKPSCLIRPTRSRFCFS